MLQEQIEERMWMLLLQVGKRCGIRRIPRLVRPGLRHLELIEQHLLQLLRAAEVHFATDERVGLGSNGRSSITEFS